MANQMVCFPRPSFSPRPGQSFAIESISWVINANGDGEIIEPVHDNPTPTLLSPEPAVSILEPVLGLPSSPRAHRLTPYRPSKHVDQDNLIASINWVDQKLAECLSLVKLVLDQSPYDDEFPPFQHFRAVGAKRSARSRRPRWQDANLKITATPEGRSIQRRPLRRSDLPEADREAPMGDDIAARLFGLTNAATVYQEAMRDRFVN
jgi:hypothetical protein